MPWIIAGMKPVAIHLRCDAGDQMSGPRRLLNLITSRFAGGFDCQFRVLDLGGRSLGSQCDCESEDGDYDSRHFAAQVHLLASLLLRVRFFRTNFTGCGILRTITFTFARRSCQPESLEN